MSADTTTNKPDPLPVLREMLGDIASALHTAREALEADFDNHHTIELVRNELGRIGWMAERAQSAAGEEGALLLGPAEVWMLSDSVREGLQALKA